MKPITPPPAPYCQLFPWLSVVIGAAVTRENMRNCSSIARVCWRAIASGLVTRLFYVCIAEEIAEERSFYLLKKAAWRKRGGEGST